MPDADESLESATPSRLPMILAAVGALVVGAGIGFGGAMLLPASAPAEAADAPAPSEPVEIDGPDGESIVVKNPDRPVTHDLGKFTLNLRGGGGGRTLRMQVQVATTALHRHTLETQTPALRDAVLTLASDYTYGDVEGLDGKQRLKDDLLAAVLEVAEPAAVKRLYFTAFTVN